MAQKKTHMATPHTHTHTPTQCRYSPHVRWARWQAKHALRAFLRRGRRGSLALGLLFAGFCVGEVSPGWRSAFCSAAMSSSKSLRYSGEGEASSASEVVMISPSLERAGTGGQAQTAVVECGVQPWGVILGCSQQNGSANASGGARDEAFQLRVLKSDHACVGCLGWALPWHSEGLQ